ncbi:MAG: DddA-like double-stranded DNA deaminase toxin [Sciscionella sp.]
MILRAERPHPGAQWTFTDADAHRITAVHTDVADRVIAGHTAGRELGPPATRPRARPHPRGQEHGFTYSSLPWWVSGYDDDADRVVELLDELGAPFPDSGPHPGAAHVEPKAAAQMRDGAQGIGVMVINHPRGVCFGAEGLSCQEILPLLLAPGAKLYVWSPGATRPARFVGRG